MAVFVTLPLVATVAKVSSAKNTIIYAIIGLVIVALAQFIVKFVLDKTVTPA